MLEIWHINASKSYRAFYDRPWMKIFDQLIKILDYLVGNYKINTRLFDTIMISCNIRSLYITCFAAWLSIARFSMSLAFIFRAGTFTFFPFSEAVAHNTKNSHFAWNNTINAHMHSWFTNASKNMVASNLIIFKLKIVHKPKIYIAFQSIVSNSCC